MPRVWKKFFRKLAEPVGFMVYVMFAVGLTKWSMENVSQGVGITVFIIMIPIPAFAYLIRDMWRTAKWEVEQENRDMMRSLEGK